MEAKVSRAGREARDRFEALCAEADGLFRDLPSAAAQGANSGPYRGLVLPALLAKARDDLGAVAELTFTGRTSGAAMVARALLETTVGVFYITSGERSEHELRACEVFLAALVDEQFALLVEEKHSEKHGKAELWTVADLDHGLRAQALDEVVVDLAHKPGPMAETLRALLVAAADDRRRWRPKQVPAMLKSIDAPATALSNLVSAYMHFYSSFSGFAHLSAALKYVAAAGEPSEGSTGIGLQAGALPVGHATPLEVALLFVPDLMARFDQTFSCGLAARISQLAVLRWAAIMDSDLGA
ncbi:MAG: hypothetical protein ACYCX3_13280 [Thermoleophilia bacterium]